MKLLIAGIAGFLGSSMAKYFAAAQPGVEIWGIDNLARRGAAGNIETLEKIGCRFVHGDLRCAGDLDSIPRMHWIFDCAANPSVLAGYGGGARAVIEHNLVGTINLLERARRDECGFTIISSSRVYSIEALAALPLVPNSSRFVLGGDISGNSGASGKGIAESFSTASPISLYGATKLSSEILALEYHHLYEIPVRIMRCGVIAGAGQFGRADQGIFSYWIHAYRAKHALKYIGFGGAGLQVRDCVHPNDVSRLALKQMAAGGNREYPNLCNVSGGLSNSMSLQELTAWCANKFGAHEIASEPDNRPLDVPWLVLDSTLAATAWNWTPEIAMPQILEEIADHAAAHPHWLDTYT